MLVYRRQPNQRCRQDALGPDAYFDAPESERAFPTDCVILYGLDNQLGVKETHLTEAQKVSTVHRRSLSERGIADARLLYPIVARS